MNSGIYEYIFANGDNYIGQAADIEKRWDQHIAKMRKGTHTKLIQDAFNRYGTPRFKVILECHPHYLDAFESMYIYTLKPSLNGNQPAHYMTKNLDITFDLDIISRNIYENIIELQRLRVDDIANTDIIEQLENKIKKLNRRVIQVAKDNSPKELKDYIDDLVSERIRLLGADSRLREAEDRISKYNQMPWYKRIFYTV